MDKATATNELRAVEDRLTVLDDERDALLKWREGLQGWLSLQSRSGPASVQPPRRAPTGKPVGAVSLRSAVLDTLREAGGKELTAAVILSRARALGADSRAVDPENVVDLILYTLRQRKQAPVERVGPRTWRWSGR